MIAYKFLAEGAVAPFTEFHWPAAGEWVSAPTDRPDVWIHACRLRDLPYWLEEELWSIELEEPVRAARYQVASPRGRLLARVRAWDRSLAREFAEACALRARDLALPLLPPALQDALVGAADLESIATAARQARAEVCAAAYVVDAAHNAQHVGPATTSYIAAVLSSSLGGGLAAFEAERAWQALWLAERLGLEAAGPRAGS